MGGQLSGNRQKMFADRADPGTWRNKLGHRGQLEDGVVDVVIYVGGAQASTCLRASRAFKGPILQLDMGAFSIQHSALALPLLSLHYPRPTWKVTMDI